MKIFSLFIWLITIIIFSHSCKKDSINEDCNSYPVPQDTYKYPIRPGMPEWGRLRAGGETLKACQIPDSLLRVISTEGLVQSWLEFPLLIELHSTNSYQRSIEFFIANFSGLKELCIRNNAADKLFQKYKTMDPACVMTYQTDIEKGNYISSFAYVELPLAQDTILNKMTLQQKKALIKEAMEKYYSRVKYANYYDVVTRDLSLFICARVLRNCQYQPFLNQVNSSLQWFISNARFYIPLGDYKTEKNIIISHSLQFIK